MEIIRGGHPQLVYALAQYEMMTNQVTYIFDLLLLLNVFSAVPKIGNMLIISKRRKPIGKGV